LDSIYIWISAGSFSCLRFETCATDDLFLMGVIGLGGYPPARLRGRKLSLKEIEKLGERNTDEIPRPSRFHRRIAHIKFRMLDGDEVWTYGTRGANGVALVREGMSIDHVITLWMSR
jgi:hypothetical protein